MNLRDTILNQFEPDIALSLVEFGKSLSRVDSDVLIFMARKSLCLYDVLLRLGIPPVERIVVSDRILDMRLDPLMGKKIALIDDSIILGTTLAKSKHHLETKAKATVEVHAFCVDTKWWQKELIKPDSIALELDDRQVMSFCAAEVRAMSLVPRPYLVDFPLSRPVRIRIADSQCLLSSVQWSSHSISTEIQERHHVAVLTFFPSELAISETYSGFGSELTNLLEIIKVRAFVRTHDDVHWLQIVPIATLKPIREMDLQLLLQSLLSKISNASGTDISNLLYSAQTPHAQHRLVQFILSTALGSNFMQSVAESVDSVTQKDFDQVEAERHYGPWLGNELSSIALHSQAALSKNGARGAITIIPARMPDTAMNWINNSLTMSDTMRSNTTTSENQVNLISDFAEIFLGLYDSREIPAREEAQKLGNAVLNAPSSEAPNRDRLEQGLPWSAIVNHLLLKYDLQPTDEIQNVFSLVLDLCNDLGISVPVTCLREGIVFRGYRHGEDVRFSDAELALAHETVKGALNATHRQSLTRIVLEKLLVLLVRVGTAKRFLEPLWGPSGMEGTVRIGFNLKGAITILTRGPKNRQDRDIWLSRYLVQRGVLAQDEVNQQYKLGNTVEGNFVIPSAPDDAFEFGYITGMLLKSSEDPLRQDAPLDDKALTILATCWSPRHAAAAIQVELDIFRDWFEQDGKKSFLAINWANRDSLSNAMNSLLRSKGHEAVHSAKMKYVGYKSGSNERKVDECAVYLRNKMNDEILARKWKSYWSAVTASRSTGEKETFDPWIDNGIKLCWEIAAALCVMEISLSTHLAKLNSNIAKLPQTVFEKLLSYSIDLSRLGVPEPGFVSKLMKRFPDTHSLTTKTFDTEQAFKYCLGHLTDLLPSVAGLVETMEPVIDEFGRIHGRHDYKYMLWYEIKDSTGTRAGRAGVDLDSYRNHIRGYKNYVNKRFHQLSIIAKRNNGEIYCHNGDASSMNDMKHIFVNGKFAQRHLTDALSMLLQGTLAYPVVRLRIYLVPCNFVGTSAFRRELAPEIQGERFWEHWSRLQKKVSLLESQFADDKSFLLVATSELGKVLNLPSSIEWINRKKSTISSEIELLSKDTAVQYGEVVVAKQ